MSKFNRPTVKASVASPVTSEATPSGTTYEGGPGYSRDAKSELFLLAVQNMVSEDTFYESAGDRDDRFTRLVHQVAVEDMGWLLGFLPWLRGEANMRTAPMVAALEAVRARLAAGEHEWNRGLVDKVLSRPDEPGEALAYWTSKYGKAIPMPIKRGIADAAVRLYTERALLRYDTDSHGFRFGDVIELTHPKPRALWQEDLFRHAIDRRHNRETAIPEALRMLHARATLMATPVERRRDVLTKYPQQLEAAGMSWEALAGWLQGPMDAAAWQAVIPTMGYMALLRNLRNFDEAGIHDGIAETICKRLSDPEQVARSRQFPFRFYAAYTNAGSLRWAWALETALGHSLANVPQLPGRTLICVDQSPSMFPGYWFSTTNRSDISLADKAKLFGSAVALRADDATLVGYGFNNYRVTFRKGDAVLRTMEKFRRDDGTDTPAAVADHYDGHDRVIIVTDEQTWQSRRYGLTVDRTVPASVPVYTWNLAGYKYGHAPSGGTNRHTFGGLSDKAFTMIPLLEAGKNANWPWED